MSVGSSKGSSESGPWWGQQPYLRDLYSRAENLFQGGELQYAGGFEGDVVAPRDPSTAAALAGTADLGLQGTSAVGAAGRDLTKTLRGDYLNPDSNPFLRQTYEQASERVGQSFDRRIAGLEQRFSRRGGPASGAYTYGKRDLLREEGDQNRRLATDIYGANYARERQIMAQAPGAAAGTSAARFAELGAAGAAGQERESYQQRLTDEEIARGLFEQEEPWERLQRFQSLLGQPIQQGSSKEQSFNIGLS